MPKRCVSTCKQFPKSECNPPRCRYIDGSQRKYCRISYKYKMNPGNCRVTRRYKKGEIRPAAKNKIRQFLNRSGRILSIVCSKSGECLAFGKRISEINSLFKGFVGFEYALDSIKEIGKPSVNGFNKQITYERNGYKANTILKSSQNPEADNLVYEYIVGTKFVNRMIRRFPCFLETYGLYFYKSPIYWRMMREHQPHWKNILDRLELQKSINYKKACEQSTYAAILIQHISASSVLDDFISGGYFNNVIQYDLIYVLFIIYQALSSLSKQFTHYDLHANNVLLYEPTPGKYIQYNYHLEGGEIISFRCRYIPKIIDYGRSFFDNGNTNGKGIYDKVCSTNACDYCGEDYGFAWLDPNSEYGICSSKKNESHDLRLLKIIHNNLNSKMDDEPENDTYQSLYSILRKVKYGVGIDNSDEKQFGTRENTTLHPNGEVIANVTDAYSQLKRHILKKELIDENQAQYSDPSKQIGILHIYANGNPMVYEGL